LAKELSTSYALRSHSNADD